MAHEQPTFFDEERTPAQRTSAPALPPISGSTTMSRHASATGALAAWKDRSPNLRRMRELWQTPRTIQEVADLTGLPINSVCSLKAAISNELTEVGFQTVHHSGGRATKRTLLQLTTYVQETR